MDTTYKMQVKINGAGRPLVLVGGGLTGWSSWDPFVDEFTAMDKQVVQVQLLNVQYGLENRALPADYSIKMESRAMAATLDSLKLSQPPDLIAWSLGALISLDYALDHPERVRSLTLIEPPAFWILHAEGSIDKETQHTLDFLNTLKDNITEEMLATFLKEAGLVETEEQARQLPQWPNWVAHRQSMRNSGAILAHRDKLERLKNLKCPVLLIKGIGSADYYHQIEDILAARLPDARIISLPGAHAAHIISRDRFMKEVKDFQK